LLFADFEAVIGVAGERPLVKAALDTRRRPRAPAPGQFTPMY
jgi:hypothetical protein